MIRAWLAFSFLMLGCTQDVQLGAGDPLAGLQSIVVTPGDTTIEITDLAAPATSLDYAATGTFSDGSSRDVTAVVAWRVDDLAPGDFVANHYTTSRRAAGVVAVNAIAGAVLGTATLRVVVTLAVTDSTFPPPVGAEMLFTPGTPVVENDATRAPAILYPADGTMFPQGLSRIVFQQHLGTSNDALRLRFESDVLHLSVLTGSDRWQPDSGIWALIAASHPGSHTTLTIDGAATTAPGTIYASAPATLSFSRSDPGGTISYWSAGANNLMKTGLGQESATELYPSVGDPTCVGCHTISRDGSKLALGYGGETLQAVDLTSGGTAISAGANLPMGWATFSPDNSLILIADKGGLVLRAATTGLPAGAPDGKVALPMKATHPDWSPDGTAVALVLSSEVSNMEVKNGSIARMPFRDGVFGAPEILVRSSNDNNYFPKWSPDGRYLAYIHATTGSHGAPSAELRLVAATGGTPIILAHANARVGMVDVADLANTMPSWGPPTGDLSWLAFASTRRYGVILPTDKQGQIWAMGIDLTKPDDPSFAAFWLPGQDARVLNNNPIWTAAASVTQ